LHLLGEMIEFAGLIAVNPSTAGAGKVIAWIP
jgi:hypothetical protein